MYPFGNALAHLLLNIPGKLAKVVLKGKGGPWPASQSLGVWGIGLVWPLLLACPCLMSCWDTPVSCLSCDHGGVPWESLGFVTLIPL